MSDPHTSANGTAETGTASSSQVTLHKVTTPSTNGNSQMTSSASSAQAFTPASTPSRCSFSTASSPGLPPVKSGPMSPDLTDDPMFERLNLNDVAVPMSMPMSPPPSAPTSPPPKAMAEFVTATRGSLIRRLSKGAMGASNRLRGRPSASVLQARDQRGGSVVRRRSESVYDGSHDVSEMELDTDDVEEYVSSRIESTMAAARNKPPMPSRRSSDRGDKPVPLPPPTTFVKISKGKQQILKLSISATNNKITWSTKTNDAAKPGKRDHIFIDDIREIRDGRQAALTLGEVSVPDAAVPRLITIVYNAERKTKHMHIVAETIAERDSWSDALSYVSRDRGEKMLGMVEQKEKTLREYWRTQMGLKYAADSSAEESMNFTLIKSTCVAYHINKPEKQLKEIFDSIDVGHTGALDLKQYLAFFRRLTESSNVRGVFDRLTKRTGGCLSFATFVHFLKHEQGIDVDASWAYWERIFNHLKDSPSVTEDDDRTMSFDAFRNFLTSDANSALLRKPKKPLDRPISDYFISSSHNTYLLGWQVKGSSSVEGYIEVLKRGCRCIEIDCWDGDNNTPMVTHGRTFSSQIKFSDCIQAVKEFAFVRSEYPLIISLEVHCNADQQAVMASIMKKHLGPWLVKEPLVTHKTSLPSPEELKGRILIKVKKPMKDDTSNGSRPNNLPKPDNASKSGNTLQKPVAHRRMRSASAPTPQTSIPDISTMPGPARPLLQTPGPGQIAHAATFNVEAPASEANNTTSDGTSSEEEAVPVAKAPTSKIVKVLGDMGVYTRGVSFSDWNSTDSKSFNHVYSFNERTFEKRSKTPELKAMMQRHNTNYLLRVYPHGSRFRSDNFDPIKFWRRGVQMVATNWQTHDLGSEINDAMFASEHDRRGYVLKPLEQEAFKIMPPVKLPKKLVKFSVRIIAGQHLGKDAATGRENHNPYVEFEMYSAEDKSRGIATGTGGTDSSNKDGTSGIGHPLRKRTMIVKGNGYDPLWDETIDMSLTTKYPGLVFVRWTVQNSSDGRAHDGREMLGAYTAKLSSLAEGYRYIHLYNKNGEALVSRLFCYIRKEDQVDIAETASPRSSLSSFGSRRGADDTNAPRKRDHLYSLIRTVSGRRPKADSIAGLTSNSISQARY